MRFSEQTLHARSNTLPLFLNITFTIDNSQCFLTCPLSSGILSYFFSPAEPPPPLSPTFKNNVYVTVLSLRGLYFKNLLL